MVQFKSKVEKDIYLFIKEYILNEQMAPLLSEIKKETGYAMKTVQDRIDGLVASGLLKRRAGETRGIYLE